MKKTNRLFFLLILPLTIFNYACPPPPAVENIDSLTDERVIKDRSVDSPYIISNYETIQHLVYQSVKIRVKMNVDNRIVSQYKIDYQYQQWLIDGLGRSYNREIGTAESKIFVPSKTDNPYAFAEYQIDIEPNIKSMSIRIKIDITAFDETYNSFASLSGGTIYAMTKLNY